MNTKQYYAHEAREDASARRWNQNSQELADQINKDLETIQGYFFEAGTNGTKKIILSISSKISNMENKLISALNGESAYRVLKAIDNGLGVNNDGVPQALDTDNPDLTAFEIKLATLELAGFAVYMTSEGQSLGINMASKFDLTSHPDGHVTAEAYPEEEEEEEPEE